MSKSIFNHMKIIKRSIHNGMEYAIYKDEEEKDYPFFGAVFTQTRYPIRVRSSLTIKQCETWLRNKIDRYPEEEKQRLRAEEQRNQQFLFMTH